MEKINYSEYLEHHGIKGQKWGVRRTPEQLGHKKTNKRLEKLARGEINTKSMIRKFGKEKVSDAEQAVREWLELDEVDYQSYKDLFGKKWKKELEKDVKFWTYAMLEDS